jgi:hypothetical protein
MYNKRFCCKKAHLIGMEICCCALLSDGAFHRAHLYCGRRAPRFFVVPLQVAVLFIVRINHSVFLLIDHNPSPTNNNSSSRAGRSKIPYFSSAVSEDWEVAQDASKYIRVLPLAAATTMARVLLMLLQPIRRLRLQGPTHTIAKNDDDARLIYHTVTDDIRHPDVCKQSTAPSFCACLVKYKYTIKRRKKQMLIS